MQRDGLKGRILLVLPTDSAAHLKKVGGRASSCMPMQEGGSAQRLCGSIGLSLGACAVI